MSLAQLSSSNIDFVSEINRLKREKSAVLLAHYYQEPQIQDIADYIGDSLGLSQQAQQAKAPLILFAGVVFMAETAKILSPKAKVVVPDLQAGCSLADNCPADKFKAFIAERPDHVVITYVNCSAEVKALSDILCTSANAEKIIRSVPEDEKIIFAPDRHLGRYLIKKTGREMVLWNGSCIVHETFDEKHLVQLKARHPAAEIIAHPECPEQILAHAVHIGSTSSLLKYVQTSSAREFIVVTEPGIIHQMKKACPTKIFHEAPQTDGCACNQCPYMRLNTLEKIYLALRDEKPEITVPADIIEKARIPLDRMLALS
ncbi:quinolinate synthase NadA [bacterium]|nr:quinolinate synthase NadA [bacterium]